MIIMPWIYNVVKRLRVSDTKSPADWMPSDKLSSRGSNKNLNSTACPYGQRAFSPLDPTASLAFTHGSGDIHVCCCQFRCSGTDKRYSNLKKTSCLPLLNAGFEPRVSGTKSPADWMPAVKLTELSKINKHFNSTTCPYGQRAFSPFDPTASWLSHLVLALNMFIVVNFDALA